MNKRLSILGIIFITIVSASYGQSEFKSFKADGFEISYPGKWISAKDGNVYNFYLDVKLGDISISVYRNSNLSTTAVKDIILELNERRSKSDTVRVNVNQNQKEYTYEYIDSDIRWLIKAIQNKKDLFLITLNWNIKDWEKDKSTFLYAFNSFKIS